MNRIKNKNKQNWKQKYTTIVIEQGTHYQHISFMDICSIDYDMLNKDMTRSQSALNMLKVS